MKKIVLTGGGTAGHVTPNIALLPSLKKAGFSISYIGSYHGIERKLIEEQNVPYYGISSGKLRRYMDIKNLTDPFRVLKGYTEAVKILRVLKPDVLFSKGGFVSVPVVFAAKHFHIPVIIHESDMTPGLANKLSFPAASKICCNFPETMKLLPPEKAVLTGSPIRAELLTGSKEKGLSYTNLSNKKPIILVVGGSQGAVAINSIIRKLLPQLLSHYQIIHLCGKGNLDKNIKQTGYVQYEYAKDELRDLFAASDLVISRAGANSICEIAALRKPNILIPLSRAASRGDQIINAHSYEKQGFSVVIEEENLSEDRLLKAIHDLYQNRQAYISTMQTSTQSNAVSIIFSLIQELS